MQAQLEYVPDYLVLKNPNAKLVDQAAYLDECIYQPTQELWQQANDLIEQQKRQMDSEKDYLKDLPMPKLPNIDSERIQAEIQRVLKEKGANDNQEP